MNNFKVFEKKVCFCIPARFASTRLPHKLLLKLNNESCIRRTIKQVLKSKYYNNNLYVLTDNELIKTELNDLNCYVLMTGEDYKNGSERISRNLSKINEKYDIIVNVQADEPYVSERNIDFCIAARSHDCPRCSNDCVFLFSRGLWQSGVFPIN